MIKGQSIKEKIDKAVLVLRSGEVLAYPTEAVYGLGCDPFSELAVNKLFHVKQRPTEKGVILVAASVEQVQDWVQLIGTEWETSVLESWPGPVTWVLPIKKSMPEWITGGRETVAIRVSNHPVVQALCNAYGGPIISTSANITGQPPAISCEQIKQTFQDQVFCIDAQLGDLVQPTQIWDARSNQQLR